MVRNIDYNKEQYRGSVKQFMKVRGLRKINLDNYFKFKNEDNLTGVHSIKIDLQDGYVNIYSYNEKTGRCGLEIEDANSEIYKNVYNSVISIFNNEKDIPANIRRNILVSFGR